MHELPVQSAIVSPKPGSTTELDDLEAIATRALWVHMVIHLARIPRLDPSFSRNSLNKRSGASPGVVVAGASCAWTSP